MLLSALCVVNEDVFCFDELHLDSLVSFFPCVALPNVWMIKHILLQGGVFVDDSGAVVALWSSYSFPVDRRQQMAEEFFGLPSRTVRPVSRCLVQTVKTVHTM